MATQTQLPFTEGPRPCLLFDSRERTSTLELPADARLLNISLGGMAVRISRQLPVGRRCGLRIGLGARPLDMSGRVRWCHETDPPETTEGDETMSFIAGLEYSDLTPALAGGVLRFIFGSRILSVQRGLFSRFTIGGDELVGLRSSHPVRVVRLDSTGLLIEAEASPVCGSELYCQLRLGDDEWRLHGLLARIEELTAPDGSSRFELAIQFLHETDRDRRLLEAWIGD